MKNLRIGLLLQRALSLVILTAVAGSGAAQTPPAANRPPPSTAAGADPGPGPTAEQISYLIGLEFGSQMRNTGIAPDGIKTESMMRGIDEGLQGKTPTDADKRQLQAYTRSTGEAMLARNAAAAKDFLARNAAAAKDFLARNAKEKGVITTASGLQYKIIKAADKKAPSIGPTDIVTVDYRGKLINGVEFDSSFSRGMPTTFPVNGVIKGWQQALVMMKPGATWRLFVPPELAYGTSSRSKIPPNSLLIFDVEIKSVEAANAPPKAPPGTPPAPRK